MWLLAKVSAGTLLTLSLALVATAVVQLTSPETTRKDREGASGALIFLLATSGFSVWLFRSVGRAQANRHQAALMSSFFELVRQDKGRISPLSFAMKTGMNGQDARKFLDAKASEFSGGFDVSENGDIVYVFESLDLG
jgi:hypothetical protein